MIDEIERDGDPTFDMDDESIDESDGENDDSDDDDDDDSDDDDDDDSDVNHSEGISDTDGSYVRPSDTLTPDAYKIKLLQRQAWTETLKRTRSHSMENGSW